MRTITIDKSDFYDDILAFKVLRQTALDELSTKLQPFFLGIAHQSGLGFFKTY